MKITLTKIGKRYNYEWIFRNINYEFTSDNSYVIQGANGSGKSTLLQLIAASSIPSEGEIKVENNSSSKIIETENIFRYISYAAPYLQLFEDFTLFESIEFHSKFKPFVNLLPTQKIISIAQLDKSRNKQVKHFSSGMKQRVKLALAILSDTPILLLDEPATNLDKQTIVWYQELIENYAKNKLVIVCSNQQEHEYSFCNRKIIMEEYKINA